MRAEEINERLLRELYLEKDMTMKEVADFLGKSKNQIRHFCRKNNIRKRKTWNFNKLKKSVKEKQNGKMVLLDKVMIDSIKDKGMVKCLVCGYEWMALMNNVIHHQTGCPRCTDNLKLSIEEMNKRIENSPKYQGRYYFLKDQKYINKDTKLKVVHLDCGFEFMAAPSGFNQETIRCPVCYPAKKLTPEIIKARFEMSERSDEYKILKIDLEEEVVDLLHYDCGKVSTNNLRRFIYLESGCKHCADNGIKLTQQEALDRLNKRNSVGEYELLEDFVYNNSKMDLKLKHLECGFEFTQRYDHFVGREQGCPNCRNSRGEMVIYNFLSNNEIDFEREFTFNGCEDEAKLRFDFAVFKDEELKCLIEYQGIQHYEPVEHFGGLKELRDRKRKDKIKEKFCQDKNIRLLKIPYYDFDNLENILEEKVLFSIKEVS